MILISVNLSHKYSVNTSFPFSFPHIAPSDLLQLSLLVLCFVLFCFKTNLTVPVINSESVLWAFVSFQIYYDE